MSDSLWLHGLQHTRLPCPSPSPRACLNSCPLSQWCHSSISPSVIPFSCLQSFPASGSFITSWHVTSGGQSSGVSASASVLPMNIHDWFVLGWQVWSPCSQRDSRESSPTWQFKNINFSALSLLYGPSLISIHDYWKNQSFDGTNLCWPSLLFNTLSRLVIAFLLRSKHLLFHGCSHHLQWFWSLRKQCHCYHCFLIYLSWNDGTGCHDLRFLNIEL